MQKRPVDPTKGNLRAFTNFRKTPDNNQPLFNGKLTLPGHADERGFALWPTVSEKSGATVLSGRARPAATAQIDAWAKPDAIDPDAAIRVAQNDGKGLTIDPDALLLFENKQKDASSPDRPDYWGYFNPGKGERLMRIAAWAGTDRSGNAMLTGNLEIDVPRKDKEAVGPSPDKDDEGGKLKLPQPANTKAKGKGFSAYQEDIDGR